MTMQECYQAMGANYDEVLGRLHSLRLVEKFTLKFLDDGSYGLLISSMEAGDWEQAFRASHTLKGVCQNLGFTRLGVSSHDLTEALRAGHTEEAATLLPQVQADYAEVVAAIEAYKASQPA